MKFLVAVDGSDSSVKALKYALEFAAEAGATLTVVHSVEPQVLVEGGETPAESFDEATDRIFTEDIEDAEERSERILRQALAVVEDAPVEVDSALLYGDPKLSVPEYAVQHDYEHVFVGHRGLSQRYQDLVGSVAMGIVERSTVSVTVVR
ncbi:MAG: universal stress protein [Halobacteriota archaeon]